MGLTSRGSRNIFRVSLFVALRHFSDHRRWLQKQGIIWKFLANLFHRRLNSLYLQQLTGLELHLSLGSNALEKLALRLAKLWGANHLWVALLRAQFFWFRASQHVSNASKKPRLDLVLRLRSNWESFSEELLGGAVLHVVGRHIFSKKILGLLTVFYH